MKIFYLLLISIFLGNVCYSQNSQSRIGAAIAVRAQGIVVVQVNINPYGKVSSAKAVSGHQLLRGIAETVSLDLKFKEETTTKNVTFNFSQKWEMINESNKEFTFGFSVIPISEFEVSVLLKTFSPRKLLLPRENGKIKDEYCNLHKELMEVEILPIIGYGLLAWINEDFGKKYEKAERKLFQNANTHIHGGCVDNGIEEQEIYFCKVCRINRNKWLQKNKK